MTLSVAIRKRLGSFDLDSRFEAPAGITALFGPSGSGKTITLRSIAGLIRPDAGRIRIGQRLLYDHATKLDVPTRERRIGYLFQQYALFPHLDVAANVGYGLHRLPRSERDQRVQALLDLVGLGEFSHHRPAQLSGGQQQRVALARALAPAPDLLLLDEPFAAVDALVRQQLRRELRAVHEQTGLPMLLVTHDLAEVRQLADYVVIYYQGAAVEAGVPDEVIAAPKSEAGATLLKAAAS